MPSTTNDRTLRAGLAVFSVLVLAYSLVIVQQILLGLLAVATLWTVYLFYHFVQVLGRIAAALERLASQRADGGTGTPPAEQPHREVADDRDLERDY
ncbi:hypothetical protein EGH21_09960 [Halomicroarcula sp. F13]|uniref:Zinc finger protein n=1 Tax=Haloarcula rubra TaxID=2487747 RepID=A0AAW4PSP7_9EURY|nr:hypothetical protein [Halomicroarcula rubra]MBX0323352.1 hypothetical protein [Halomicroarcula rubra]